MLRGIIHSVRPLQDLSALPGHKKTYINGERYAAWHILQGSAQTHSDRVYTEKSFQNSQTFHNMAQKSNTKVRNSSAHPVKGRNP